MVTGSARRALDVAAASIVEAPFRGPIYRLVRANPPGASDFLSQWAKNLEAVQTGQRPRAVPDRGDTLHMWAGVSTYDEATAARRVAAQYPNLGGFMVLLRLPAGSPIRIEKTGTDTHHFTVWGAPERLLLCVESIESV